LNSVAMAIQGIHNLIRSVWQQPSRHRQRGPVGSWLDKEHRLSFHGFSPKTTKFLKDLDKNNTREWFEKHRPDYEEHVMGPAREFVLAMADRLDQFDPAIEATPKVNRSIRRINRDTRFSKDKRPYKNHLDFYFPHGGFKGRPGYWLRLTPKQVGLGAGLHGFDDRLLKEWRQAIDAEKTGKPLAASLARLEKAKYHVYGEHYKRVPKGFDADHPRADLLKYAGIHVGVDVSHPEEFTTKAFPTFVMGHFRKLRPVTDWLAELTNN